MTVYIHNFSHASELVHVYSAVVLIMHRKIGTAVTLLCSAQRTAGSMASDICAFKKHTHIHTFFQACTPLILDHNLKIMSDVYRVRRMLGMKLNISCFLSFAAFKYLLFSCIQA